MREPLPVNATTAVLGLGECYAERVIPPCAGFTWHVTSLDGMTCAFANEWEIEIHRQRDEMPIYGEAK